MRFPAHLSAVILLALPAGLGAQRGAAPPFEGPRGYLTLDLSDGEPISAYIEVSKLLDLSEVQRRRLMDIRRSLRFQNLPYMARLDSLRQLAGVNLGEAERVRRKDEEALRRFNAWARPAMDSIRQNNDVARLEARQILSADQRRRFDSVVVASRERRGGGVARRPVR